MKAIGNYLVVDKIKTKVSKVAGLELTESQNKDVRYQRATVITCGDEVKGVSEGDIVMYDKHAGHGIEFEEKLYQVIRLSDIVIVE
tara:strand:+ start:146 stop:403 length:258 start_codon:yes stop_codon:yes gene_type:complete